MVTGVLMYAPSQEAKCIVHLDFPDGTCLLRPWKGRTILAIHRAARERYAIEYPTATVSFGRGWYVTR